MEATRICNYSGLRCYCCLAKLFGGQMMKKEYLGDSVYAEIISGMVMLTTDNGHGADQRIYLEMFVFKALVDYVQRVSTEGKG